MVVLKYVPACFTKNQTQRKHSAQHSKQAVFDIAVGIFLQAAVTMGNC
jgi:hypothetical protein